MQKIINEKLHPQKEYINYSLWGQGITLEKTNNNFWYAYFPLIDMTIKSRKADDLVIQKWRGRHGNERIKT